VTRTPVFGLGCAGGVSGLALAARLAEARPGSNVLFVTVELCTLAFRLDKLTKANIVATALFGDGAAACILRAPPIGESGGGLATVAGAGEHTWPDTLDIMGWNVDPEGFDVIFARAIPPFAARHMGPAVRGILAQNGLEAREVGRFICHPGGTKVVAALETTLALEPGSLDHERAVLSEFGNMSAPTVLFVLERVLAASPPDRMALAALGPGFTASSVVLERAA
jgi:alkylresorcinol/alkylpyrone synthase